MAFKKHIPMLIEEKQTREKSELFSFSGRKEKLKKYFENINLHPIDCSLEEFSKYSPKSQTKFKLEY